MSDPVTKVDIDDVLTSIRRLVAEGDRSRPAANSADAAQPNTPDRLVLTPDFRVNANEELESSQSQLLSDDADTQPRIEGAGAAIDVSQDDALVLRAEQSVPADGSDIDVSKDTLEATIAELENRVAAKLGEWEPDGSEVRSEPTWESAGFFSRARRDAGLDDTDTAESEPQTSDFKSEGVDSAPLRLGDPVLPPSQPAQDSDPDEDTIISRLVLEAFSKGAQAANSTEPKSEPRVDPAENAPQEVVQARSSNELTDEDGDFGDDFAPAPASTNDEVLDQYLNNSGPLVDEAMLKQLVKEAVREELQGALGERITRNVRKLVRREINALLTQQDFD